MIYTNDDWVKKTIMRRKPDSHKGDYGRLLIFAGSPGMAGAATLCGRAALRTGAGLAGFLLPSIPCEIYPILQTTVPEATCVAFSGGMDLNAYDVIVAGCGLGKGDDRKEILGYILETFGAAAGKAQTLVLDADALNIISEDPALAAKVKDCKAAVIITPHPGEAKRLIKSCAGISGLSARKDATCALAEAYDCVALLKGAGTLIATKDGGSTQIYENTTGNPGMATGGSGDVLSGIIGSLAGQGYGALDAARLGAFIHGKAGDIAAEKLGEMSVTAGDIIDNIPAAILLYY